MRKIAAKSGNVRNFRGFASKVGGGRKLGERKISGDSPRAPPVAPPLAGAPREEEAAPFARNLGRGMREE